MVRLQTIVRGFEWLLVAALVFSHLVLLVLLPNLWLGWDSYDVFPVGLNPFETTYVGATVRTCVPMVQAALLVVLAFAGPGRWFVRWPLSLLAAALVFGTIADNSLNLASVVAMVSGALAAGFIGLRCFGWRLTRHAPPQTGRLKFSIRTLLIATFITGAAFGTVQLIRQAAESLDVVPEFWGRVSLATAFTIVSYTGLWSVCMGDRWFARSLAFLAIAPLCGAAFPYSWNREYDILAISGWFLVYAIMFGGSLLVLRCGGWRLARVPQAARPTTQKSPVSETVGNPVAGPTDGRIDKPASPSLAFGKGE